MQKNKLIVISGVIATLLVVCVVGCLLAKKKASTPPDDNLTPPAVAMPTSSPVAMIPPTDTSLAGQWQDTISQRASMSIAATGDNQYQVDIYWSSSASEMSHWTFAGTFDVANNSLTYTDGTYIVETTTDDGTTSEEIVSTSESGSLVLEADQLRWYDNSEPEREALFVKVSDFASQTDSDVSVAQEIVMEEFSRFGEGFVLESLTYNPERSHDPQELAYVNSLERGSFDKLVFFDSLFHTPASFDELTAWEPDLDYTYTWYVARDQNGDWQLVTYGY